MLRILRIHHFSLTFVKGGPLYILDAEIGQTFKIKYLITD